MTSINRVLLLGNLTRDPELRYIQSGAAVCQFGLGLTRRWTNGAGELQEDPCFVFVEGRLQLDDWQTEAGEKRSRLKVVAQRVTFLYRPAPSGAPGEATPDWVKEEA